MDGACNTTEIKTKEGNLETDIVVQVTTNVKENSSDHIAGSTDDTEIPIVLGTSGVKEAAGRRNDQGNVVIPPTAPVFVPYNVNKNFNQQKHHIHYDPNYSNHYFGESPPPVYVWYKTKATSHNPQAFIPGRINTRPLNNWQGNTYNINRQYSPNGWSPSTVCTCTNPALNWYPSNDHKIS